MPRHRVTFWKTTITSAVAMFAFTALMAGLLGWSSTWQSSHLTVYLGLVLALILIMPLAAMSGLITVGGLIALQRDALEAVGQPYAQSSPREATSTFIIAAIRTLFGAACLGLCPGDDVEIRLLAEILETLDANGRLDGLPFMPEMAAYCGKRARVFRRVNKLVDWVHGTGLKRMRGIVLLDGLRCDGSAHGMCQSNCHLRWREEWLRPVPRTGLAGETAEQSPPPQSQLAKLSTLATGQTDAGMKTRYFCQATELTAGGLPMQLADPRHYVRDFLTGNVRLKPLCISVALAAFNRAQRKSHRPQFPHHIGRATDMVNVALDLRPGDLVRVKPKALIELTLNSQSRNRGLHFDREMIRFCGGVYRVKARLDRVIVEKTGELRHLKTPCIILDGVTATGEFQGLNPENEYIFWREVWLERCEPSSARSAISAPSPSNDRHSK